MVPASYEDDFQAVLARVAQAEADYAAGREFFQVFRSDESPVFWSGVLGVAVPVGWTLAADVYDGPAGKGWILRALAPWGGRTWARAANRGPEAYRESPWAEASAAG